MAIENLSITTAPFSGIVGEALPAGSVELIITHDEGIALQTSDFSIGGAQLLGNDGPNYLWNTVGANVTEGIIQVSFEPYGANHVKAVVNHGAITIQEDQHNFYIDIDWNPQPTTDFEGCCDISTSNTSQLLADGCNYGSAGNRTEEFLECYREISGLIVKGDSKWYCKRGNGPYRSTIPTPENESSHPPHSFQKPVEGDVNNLGYDITFAFRPFVTYMNDEVSPTFFGNTIDEYGYPGPCEILDTYTPPGFPPFSHAEITNIPQFAGMQFGVGSTIPFQEVSEEVIDQAEEIWFRMVFQEQLVFNENLYAEPGTSQVGTAVFKTKIANLPDAALEQLKNMFLLEVDWSKRSNPSGMPQGGSNPAISGLSISPRTLTPGSYQSVTASISGSPGAEYVMVAYDSEGNYYNVEPETSVLAENDSIEKRGRIENQNYTWDSRNHPSALPTRIMSGRKKNKRISIPKTTNADDVEIYFYVEPRGNTILAKNCPTKENPIVRKNISEKTVTLTVLESVTGVTSTTTSTGNLTLKPNRKYKTERVTTNETPDGCIEFTIFLSHASSVASSVGSFTLDDSFINVYKLVDGSYTLIDRGSDDELEEYGNKLLELGEFGVSGSVRDKTLETATCTISGKVSVRNIKNNSIKIEIDLDQIITTS